MSALETVERRTVERHLSPAQVAERLGVSVCTVWRLIGRGEIRPVRKLGRRTVRIPESSVAQFLARHTV